MPTAPPLILVVDDDFTSLSVIRYPLEQAGYRLVVAEDGTTAFNLSQESEFDLIISDVGLPDISGIELIRQLRMDAGYEQTPVILITSKSYELEIAQVQADLAIARVFDKPFSPKALLRTVRELLNPS